MAVRAPRAPRPPKPKNPMAKQASRAIIGTDVVGSPGKPAPNALTPPAAPAGTDPWADAQMKPRPNASDHKPSVQPFLTGGQIVDAANQAFNQASSQANLDFSWGKTQKDTEMAKLQVQDSAKKALAATADAMAARGMFASSIKDAALFDLEAQRALQTRFLDDNLTIARTLYDTSSQALAAQAAAAAKGFNQLQVENANAISSQQVQAGAGGPGGTAAQTGGTGSTPQVQTDVIGTPKRPKPRTAQPSAVIGTPKPRKRKP